jgi:hypothetical protein
MWLMRALRQFVEDFVAIEKADFHPVAFMTVPLKAPR